jgi:hypothetical protein
MTFNEFQRELRKRDIPPNVAYILTLLWERFVECEKTVETQAKITLDMANSMQGLVQLREMDQRELKRIARGLGADGIGVNSVANEPEKH